MLFQVCGRMKWISNLVCVGLLLCCASGDRWDDRNDPRIFSNDYNYALKAFPHNAVLKKIPWTDDYWGNYHGGIAYRWNVKPQVGFNYTLLTKEQVHSASWDHLATLSPAEKFDIFNGRYDYPTVWTEWNRSKPTDPDWEGICHGWAPASGFFHEPRNTTVKSKEGVSVPFGSSDIKALLSYLIAMVYPPNSKAVGLRCPYNITDHSSPYRNDPACKDINAAAFHVILTNQIAGKDEFFVADVDRSEDVWNQPIHQYDMFYGKHRKPSAEAAPGTVRELKVDVKMSYVSEKDPQWTPYGIDRLVESRKYNYYLELGSNDTILGGNWESYDRPDFFWVSDKPTFFGYFLPLEEIYKAAIPSNDFVANHYMRMLEHEEENHVNYKQSIGVISANQQRRTSNAWTIQPKEGTKSISIEFTKLNTIRHKDFVRVFEGSRGEGPLLAVFSGKTIPDKVTFQSGALFVRFQTTEEPGDFELKYYSSSS